MEMVFTKIQMKGLSMMVNGETECVMAKAFSSINQGRLVIVSEDILGLYMKEPGNTD